MGHGFDNFANGGASGFKVSPGGASGIKQNPGGASGIKWNPAGASGFKWNPVSDSTNSGVPTIRLGSQGFSVAYCQNLLNARIIQFPVLWVDGIFGPKTDQRLRQFQIMKQLDVDGIVGPMTWAALEAGPPVIIRR